MIPEGIRWLSGREDGRAWLAALPGLLRASCDRFELKLSGDVYCGGHVSYVVPARGPDGDVALKLCFPDRESAHEADALALWNGRGAVRLLRRADDLGAMVLERCRPGTFLADAEDTDVIGVMAGLLRQLMILADGRFHTLRDEAAIWAASLTENRERSADADIRRLTDAALDALGALETPEGESVLLHQDLHGHNVLAAERAPWLAIDPKPLAGDPAFALSPVVRSYEFGGTREATLYRLDRLSEDLELDRERARLWCIAQTMAWSFSSETVERHHETVRWLLRA